MLIVKNQAKASPWTKKHQTCIYLGKASLKRSKKNRSGYRKHENRNTHHHQPLWNCVIVSTFRPEKYWTFTRFGFLKLCECGIKATVCKIEKSHWLLLALRTALKSILSTLIFMRTCTSPYITNPSNNKLLYLSFRSRNSFCLPLVNRCSQKMVIPDELGWLIIPDHSQMLFWTI